MISFEINQELLPSRYRLQEIWVKRLLRAIEKHLKLRGATMLSIAFVSQLTIRRLNHDYRGKDQVTDILSFEGVGGKKSLGELILAWPYVAKQAKQKKVSLEQELALLLIHGVLHLKGYDHETDLDAQLMLPLQNKILASIL